MSEFNPSFDSLIEDDKTPEEVQQSLHELALDMGFDTKQYVYLKNGGRMKRNHLCGGDHE